MTAPAAAASSQFDRSRLVPVADWLAVGLAVSLPWSTSATAILVGLWLLAALPTLDAQGVRRELMTAAGGLPVALWAFGAIGMLWADVSWSERFGGLSSFHKLLLVPVMLAYFRHSERGREILTGFLASCAALLVVSWVIYFGYPLIPNPGKSLGVPVKDYISQSAMFSVCILVLLHLASDRWKEGRHRMAACAAACSLVFLANILFVATSRTALVTIPILLALFGLMRGGWKWAGALLVGFALVVMLSWSSASFLRDRVAGFFVEVGQYRKDGEEAKATPASERIVFWKRSVGFIASAPALGHGTGSIREQFRRASGGETGVGATVASNPHNQILAVAVQLGIVGAIVLVAMWAAHLMLFMGGGFLAWVGFVIVAHNVIASLFNSHIFDFTHGWLYVIGVGIAGGQVLRMRRRPADPPVST